MLKVLRPGVTVRPAQLVAARTSAAPSSGLVIVTVADARLALSRSSAVRPGSTTTGEPPAENVGEPPPAVSTGGSLTAVTLTSLFAVLLAEVPSLTAKAMFRVVVLGFCEASSKVTERRQVWYVAGGWLPEMPRLLRPGVTVRPAQLVAPSPSNAPSCGLVMVTVADTRFGLSASVTVMPPSTTT